MRLPKPEPGLVIRYAYLWHGEFQRGREEGSKDRPCAIVLAAMGEGAETRILVVPVTHRPPAEPSAAIEITHAIKRHLGLDDQRSWVVLSESNLFDWPGPDLRPIGERGKDSVAYGLLPPRFFTELRARFVRLESAAKSRRVLRTE